MSNSHNNQFLYNDNKNILEYYFYENDKNIPEELLLYREKILNSIGKKTNYTGIISSNYSDKIKFICLTDPIPDRLYGSYYDNRKIEKCQKERINRGMCVFRVSYDLAFSLGDNYLNAEGILCKDLIGIEKTYCYESLGKRIGEKNFFNVSNGIKECKEVNNQFKNICITSVCNVQRIFRPYANNSEC